MHHRLPDILLSYHYIGLCNQGRHEQGVQEQGQLFKRGVVVVSRGASGGLSHDAEARPRSRLEPRRRAPVEPPQLDAVLTIDPEQAGVS
eukprot:COSAG02_NODE_4613_length_5167_cov_40.171468_3_plen_89_part_00